MITGACIAGQWLLVQIPLWALAIGYGMRLRHWTDPPEEARDRQFGIRQLLVLTAIVAVVLGVCRLAIAQTAEEFRGADWGEALVFVFLAWAGVVMTLPLLIAALLPRFSLPAVAAVIVLIALGTWYELPLVMLIPGRGGGPDLWHLAFINAFQAAWVLAVATIVRLGGYGIGHKLHAGEPYKLS